MQRSTRVEISGLTGRPELNGCKGVALYLVPARERYLIQLDGSGEQIGVKPGNLRACEHVEEKSGDMVTVHGLNYCTEHRREICSLCSYDFRIMNRMSQLEEGEDVYERAMVQNEAEAAKNVPPLHAPTRSSVKPQAAPSGPALSKATFVGKGLDPTTLATWPAGESVGQRFQDCFSFREKMMSHAGGAPSADEDPLYHVRESLYCLAERIDLRRGTHLPAPRFSMQDEAQTEVIFIDVVEVKTGPAGWANFEATKVVNETVEVPQTKEVPLLVVRYGYYTSGNMAQFVGSMEESMRMKIAADRRAGFTEAQATASGFQNLPSHPKEIAIVRNLLDSNRKRLLPAFIERATEGLPAGWSVSVLQPVAKEADVAPAAKDVCAKCGKAGEKLLNCSRCKVQKYCSKECQVADWKPHKKHCHAPEKAAHADVIRVQMAAAGCQTLPGMTKEMTDKMGGMHMVTMSHDTSSAAAIGGISHANASTTSSLPPDAMFVVKIQVPLNAGADADAMGMMVYDQTRTLQTQIHPRCMAPADYQRLDGIIRASRTCNGLKGYFNAFLDKAGDLHIVADTPLPQPKW